MATKVEAYAAADGKVFATEGEAVRHDNYLAHEARRTRLHNLAVEIYDNLDPLQHQHPDIKIHRGADGFAEHFSQFLLDHWPEIGIAHEYFDDVQAAYVGDEEQPAPKSEPACAEREPPRRRRATTRRGG